jgi:GNAT superfamily N-acetyltransferase
MESSSPVLEIRRAGVTDADAIAVLLRGSFAELEPLYTPEGFAATTPSSHEIRPRFREGPVWVAVLGSTIVGTVSVLPQEGALHVRSMAVHPRARGQGVAGRLLAEVEHYAAFHGYRRLTLSTTPFLLDAIRLYERAGFVAFEGGTTDLFGTRLFVMEKHLT